MKRPRSHKSQSSSNYTETFLSFFSLFFVFFIMKFTCALCNGEFNGHGHNPSPFGLDTEKCCDTCNVTVVAARAVKIPKEWKSAPPPVARTPVQTNPLYPWSATEEGNPHYAKDLYVDDDEVCVYCRGEIIDGMIYHQLEDCPHLYCRNHWKKCRLTAWDDPDLESKCHGCSRDVHWTEWRRPKVVRAFVKRQAIEITDDFATASDMAVKMEE